MGLFGDDLLQDRSEVISKVKSKTTSKSTVGGKKNFYPKKAKKVDVDSWADEDTDYSSDFEPSKPEERKSLGCYIGHKEIEQDILNAFAQNELPHAFIFHGSKGVGKFTMAMRLAKFLLHFEQSGADFISPLFAQVSKDEQQTDSSDVQAAYESLDVNSNLTASVQVDALSHPDFLLLQRSLEDQKVSMSVEESRKVSHFLRLTPSISKWRVVVIDNAHELTMNGQNALLKILEEPPKRTVLILVTDQFGKILPTIKSRCRKIAFSNLSDEMIARALEEIGIEDISQIEKRQIIQLSRGSLGKAIQYIDHGALGIYFDLLDMLKEYHDVTPKEIDAFVARFTQKDSAIKCALLKEFVLLWVYKMNRYISTGEISFQLVEAENDFLRHLAQFQRSKFFVSLWERIEDEFKKIDDFKLDTYTSLSLTLRYLFEQLRSLTST